MDQSHPNQQTNTPSTKSRNGRRGGALPAPQLAQMTSQQSHQYSLPLSSLYISEEDRQNFTFTANHGGGDGGSGGSGGGLTGLLKKTSNRHQKKQNNAVARDRSTSRGPSSHGLLNTDTSPALSSAGSMRDLYGHSAPGKPNSTPGSFTPSQSTSYFRGNYQNDDNNNEDIDDFSLPIATGPSIFSQPQSPHQPSQHPQHPQHPQAQYHHQQKQEDQHGTIPCSLDPLRSSQPPQSTVFVPPPLPIGSSVPNFFTQQSRQNSLGALFQEHSLSSNSTDVGLSAATPRLHQNQSPESSNPPSRTTSQVNVLPSEGRTKFNNISTTLNRPPSTQLLNHLADGDIANQSPDNNNINNNRPVSTAPHSRQHSLGDLNNKIQQMNEDFTQNPIFKAPPLIHSAQNPRLSDINWNNDSNINPTHNKNPSQTGSIKIPDSKDGERRKKQKKMRPTSHQLETLLLTRRDKILYYHQFRSLYLFQPDNLFRRLCIQLSHNKWIEWFLLIVVAVSVFFIARASNEDNRLFAFQKGTDYWVEVVVNSILSIEMIMKIIAFGFVDSGQHSYLRSGPTNWIDMAMVIIGWLSVSHVFDGPTPTDLDSHAFLRQLRIIRLCKVLSSLEATRLQLNVILMSIPSLFAVMCSSLSIFLIFTYIFHQFSRPMTFRCIPSETDLALLTPIQLQSFAQDGAICSTIKYWGYHCPNLDEMGVPLSCIDIGVARNDGLMSFDNFGISFFNVMLSLSFEGWSDIMVDYTSASEFGRGMYIFWVIFMIFCGFIISKLISTVLAINYQQSVLFEKQRQRLLIFRKKLQALVEHKRREYLHQQQEQEQIKRKNNMVTGAQIIGDIDEDNNNVTCQERYSTWCSLHCGCLEFGGMSLKRYDIYRDQRPGTKTKKEQKGCHPGIQFIQTKIRHLVLHTTAWSWLTIIFVLYNTAVLISMRHIPEIIDPSDPSKYLQSAYINWYVISSIITLAFFCLDAIIKFIAYGLKGYFKYNMNLFELAITILSVTFFFSTGMTNNSFSILHLLRILRLIEDKNDSDNGKMKSGQDITNQDDEATINQLYFLKAIMASIKDIFCCLVILLGFVFVVASIGRSFLKGEMFQQDFFSFAKITFQSLTPENINDILLSAKAGRDGAAGWGQLIFIFILYFIGFYFILALFLAVLLANFDLQSDAKEIELEELRRKQREQLESDQVQQGNDGFNHYPSATNFSHDSNPNSSNKGLIQHQAKSSSQQGQRQILQQPDPNRENNLASNSSGHIRQLSDQPIVPSYSTQIDPSQQNQHSNRNLYYEDTIGRNIQLQQFNDDDSSSDDDQPQPNHNSPYQYQPPPQPYQNLYEPPQQQQQHPQTNEYQSSQSTSNYLRSSEQTSISSQQSEANLLSSSSNLGTSSFFFTTPHQQNNPLLPSSNNLDLYHPKKNHMYLNGLDNNDANNSSGGNRDPLPPPAAPPSTPLHVKPGQIHPHNQPSSGESSTHSTPLSERFPNLNADVHHIDQKLLLRSKGRSADGVDPIIAALDQIQPEKSSLATLTKRRFVHVPWHHRPLHLTLWQRLLKLCTKSCASRYNSLTQLQKEYQHHIQQDGKHIVDHLYIEQHLRPIHSKVEHQRDETIKHRDLAAFEQAVQVAVLAKRKELSALEEQEQQLLLDRNNNITNGQNGDARLEFNDSDDEDDDEDDHEGGSGSESGEDNNNKNRSKTTLATKRHSTVQKRASLTSPTIQQQHHQRRTGQDYRNLRRSSAALIGFLPALPGLRNNNHNDPSNNNNNNSDVAINNTNATYNHLNRPARQIELANLQEKAKQKFLTEENTLISADQSNATVQLQSKFMKPVQGKSTLSLESDPSDILSIQKVIRHRSSVIQRQVTEGQELSLSNYHSIYDNHNTSNRSAIEPDQDGDIIAYQHSQDYYNHTNNNTLPQPPNHISLLSPLHPDLDSLLDPLRLDESNEIIAARVSVQRALKEQRLYISQDPLDVNSILPYTTQQQQRNNMSFLSSQQQDQYYDLLMQQSPQPQSAQLYSNGSQQTMSQQQQHEFNKYKMAYDNHQLTLMQQHDTNKKSIIASQDAERAIMNAKIKLQQALSHESDGDDSVIDDTDDQDKDNGRAATTPMHSPTGHVTHPNTNAVPIPLRFPLGTIDQSPIAKTNTLPQPSHTIELTESNLRQQDQNFSIPQLPSRQQSSKNLTSTQLLIEQQELVIQRQFRDQRGSEKAYYREELISAWISSGAVAWPPLGVKFEDDDERRFRAAAPKFTQLDRFVQSCTKIFCRCTFFGLFPNAGRYNTLYTQWYIKSRYRNNVCCCVGPKNIIRRLLITFLRSPITEALILLVILYSCVILAIDVPRSINTTVLTPRQQAFDTFLDISNYAVTGFFILEILLKMFTQGIIFGHGTYLSDWWNVIDFIATVTSSIAIIYSGTHSKTTATQPLGFLLLRSLRSLRSIRFLTLAQSTREVIPAIWQAIGQSFPVVCFGLLIFVIYGVLGVHFFKSKLYRCFDPNDPFGDRLLALNQLECLSAGGIWRNPLSSGNFDHLGSAFLVLFQFSNMEAWPTYLYDLAAARSWYNAPLPNYNTWATLYVIFGIVLLGFFFTSLLSGVIIGAYESSLEIDLHPIQSTFLQLYRIVLDHRPITLLLPPSPPHRMSPHTLYKKQSVFLALCLWVMEPGEGHERLMLQSSRDVGRQQDQSSESPKLDIPPELSTSEQTMILQSIAQLSRDLKLANNTKSISFLYYRFRLSLYQLIMWQYFDLLPLFLVLINVIMTAILHTGINSTYRTITKWVTVIVSVCLVLEMIIKLLALGPSQYFSYHRFRFQAVISLFSLIDLFTVQPGGLVDWYSLYISPKIFSTIRVFRLFELVNYVPRVKKLLSSLVFSLRVLTSLGFIFALIIFIYAIIGINLFSNYPTNYEYYNDHFNFSSFFNAIMFLFKSITGESWPGVMGELQLNSPFCDDTIHRCGHQAYSIVYFVTFQIILTFLILNMVLAVVFSHIEVDFQDTAIQRLNKLNSSKAAESDVGMVGSLFGKMWRHFNRFRDTCCTCPGCSPERKLVRERKLLRLQRKQARIALQKQREREIAQRQRREFQRMAEGVVFQEINLDQYQKDLINRNFVAPLEKQNQQTALQHQFKSPEYISHNIHPIDNVATEDHDDADDQKSEVSSISSRTSSDEGSDSENSVVYMPNTASNRGSHDDNNGQNIELVCFDSGEFESPVTLGRESVKFKMTNLQRHTSSTPISPQRDITAPSSIVASAPNSYSTRPEKININDLRRKSVIFMQEHEFNIDWNDDVTFGRETAQLRTSTKFGSSSTSTATSATATHNGSTLPNHPGGASSGAIFLRQQMLKRRNRGSLLDNDVNNDTNDGSFVNDSLRTSSVGLTLNGATTENHGSPLRQQKTLHRPLNFLRDGFKNNRDSTHHHLPLPPQLTNRESASHNNRNVNLNDTLHQQNNSHGDDGVNNGNNIPNDDELKDVYSTPHHLDKLLNVNPDFLKQFEKTGIDKDKLRQYTTTGDAVVVQNKQLLQQQSKQQSNVKQSDPYPPPPPLPSSSSSLTLPYKNPNLDNNTPRPLQPLATFHEDDEDELEIRRSIIYKRPSLLGHNPPHSPKSSNGRRLSVALSPQQQQQQQPQQQQQQQQQQKRPSLLGQNLHQKRPSLLGQTTSQKRPSLLAQQSGSTSTQTSQLYKNNINNGKKQGGDDQDDLVPMAFVQSTRETQSQCQLQSSIMKMMRLQQTEMGIGVDYLQHVLKTNMDSEELIGGEEGPGEDIPPPPPPTLYDMEYDIEMRGGSIAAEGNSLQPPPGRLRITSTNQAISSSAAPSHTQQQQHTQPHQSPFNDGLTNEALISSILTIPTITKSTSGLPITNDDLDHFSSVWSRLTRAHMYYYESESQNMSNVYQSATPDSHFKEQANIRHFVTPTTSYQDTIDFGQLQTNPYKLHVTQLPTLIARLRPPLRPQLTSTNIRQLLSQNKREAQLFLLPFKIYYQQELQHISEQILQFERDIFTCQQTLNKFTNSSYPASQNVIHNSDSTSDNNEVVSRQNNINAYKRKLIMLTNTLQQYQQSALNLETEYLSFLDLCYQTLSNLDEEDINNNAAIMLLIDELNIPSDGLYCHFIDVLYSLTLRVLSTQSPGNDLNITGESVKKNYAKMARDYIVDLAQEQLLLNIVRMALRKQDLMAFVHHQYQAAADKANSEYSTTITSTPSLPTPHTTNQNRINNHKNRNNNNSNNPNNTHLIQNDSPPLQLPPTNNGQSSEPQEEIMMILNPLNQPTESNQNKAPLTVNGSPLHQSSLPTLPIAERAESILFNPGEIVQMIVAYEKNQSDTTSRSSLVQSQSNINNAGTIDLHTIPKIDYNPSTSTTPPISLQEAFAMSDIDAVSFIVDQIPFDDVRLQVLREEAVKQYPQRYMLVYGDGSTPITHYDNDFAQPVSVHKKRLVTATSTHYSYDAGDILRIVKIQRQWRLRKEAKIWRQIMLYMDKSAIREALFVE